MGQIPFRWPTGETKLAHRFASLHASNPDTIHIIYIGNTLTQAKVGPYLINTNLYEYNNITL